MATLVLYQTRYGYTAECANKLPELLDDVTTVSEFSLSKLPTLELYDTIVFAGSMRFGQIQPEIKQWLIANEASLDSKDVAFFIACGFDDNFNEYVEKSFPAALVKRALACVCVGGTFSDDMGFIDRKIVAMVRKEAEKKGQPLPSPKPEALETLAAALNAKYAASPVDG